jgi:hypothetical protein
MHFVLNRDHVMVTETGLSYQFEKGKPTFIPKRFADRAIVLGAEPVVSEDKEELAVDAAEAAARKAELDARPAQLEAAIRTLMDRNQARDFTAGGRPNLVTLRVMLGYEVTAAEMDPIWEKVKQSRED